jgi:hypothetical protein
MGEREFRRIRGRKSGVRKKGENGWEKKGWK